MTAHVAHGNLNLQLTSRLPFNFQGASVDKRRRDHTVTMRTVRVAHIELESSSKYSNHTYIPFIPSVLAEQISRHSANEPQSRYVRHQTELLSRGGCIRGMTTRSVVRSVESVLKFFAATPSLLRALAQRHRYPGSQATSTSRSGPPAGHTLA